MNVDILKVVGQVAGIGGISLGVFLILFKNIIRKNIFPNLTKAQGFKIIKLILILIWSIAVIGIVAWFSLEFTKAKPQKNGKASDTTVVSQSDVNINGNENTIINKPEQPVNITNNYDKKGTTK